MNKGQLVEDVAKALGEPKTVASKAVEAVINAIVEGTNTHDKVAISGFGTFRKKHRKARVGRNPATNEPIDIPAAITIGFSPSQALKARMTDNDRVAQSIEPKHHESVHST